MKTIIRVKKNPNNPFVMMDKRPLENKEMSWKAKGILAYLLSRPDDWQVRRADLLRRATDGDTALRSGLEELKQAGHLKNELVRNDQGEITDHILVVYEIPHIQGDLYVENPQVGKTTNRKTHNKENRNHTNKDFKDKEKDNNKETTNNNGRGRYQNIFQLYSSEIGGITPTISDKLKLAEEDYTWEWIQQAFKIAAENNVRKWKYISSILKNWEDAGGPDNYEHRDTSHRDYIEDEFAEYVE